MRPTACSWSSRERLRWTWEGGSIGSREGTSSARWVLAPGRRLAAVTAVEPVRALRVHADAFRSFLLRHPGLALSVLRTLVLRLREVEQRIDAWMAS